MTTTKLENGRKYIFGCDEDREAGVVDSIDGDAVTVRWDSGIVTTQPSRAFGAATSTTEPHEDIRYSTDATVCMVYRDGEPVRCPTQDDMDTLPVGEDMTDEDMTDEDE